MKLNKRQRKFLRNFSHDTKMQEDHNGRWCWGGDEYAPASRGPVSDGLINAGLLEEVRFGSLSLGTVRLTAQGYKYFCSRADCMDGKIYQEDSEDWPECPVCEGVGVLAVEPDTESGDDRQC